MVLNMCETSEDRLGEEEEDEKDVESIEHYKNQLNPAEIGKYTLKHSGRGKPQKIPCGPYPQVDSRYK